MNTIGCRACGKWLGKFQYREIGYCDQHLRTAYRTRRAGKAAGDLFDAALES